MDNDKRLHERARVGYLDALKEGFEVKVIHIMSYSASLEVGNDIQSHINSTRNCGVIFKLEIFSHL